MQKFLQNLFRKIQKIPKKFSKITNFKKLNFNLSLTKNIPDKIIFLILFFLFGCAFFINFEENINQNFPLFLSVFFLTIPLIYLNKNSSKYLIYSLILAFLTGGIYVKIYNKFSSNSFEVNGKIYADLIGKIEYKKEFQNSRNGQKGVFLVISKPQLYKSGAILLEKKSSNSKNKLSKKKRVKKSKINSEKIYKLTKTQQKNYLNVENLQAIDQEFLELKNGYQNINWQKLSEKDLNFLQQFSENLSLKDSKNLLEKEIIFSKKINKISLIIPKIPSDKNFEINDIIFSKISINPFERRDFPDGFNVKLNSKIKGVFGSGYGFGKIEILQKNQISNLDNFFLNLRETISNKINSKNLNIETKAILSAILIGEKKFIPEEFEEKIRNSGLSHILVISGFHLSLASFIFFLIIRFFLSKNEYLTLNFDIKKIAIIFSIIASFAYLKIANSPIPAQRAFLIILLVCLSLIFNEKANLKRLTSVTAFFLILYNPYFVFSLSFQLSFIAVLTIIFVNEEFFAKKLQAILAQNYFKKFLTYFAQIIAISLAIQITTLPILLYYFHNFQELSVVANFFAIPLFTFFIMPFAILFLFLMPFSLEKFALYFLEKFIEKFIQIIELTNIYNFDFFAKIDFPRIGFLFAIIAILFIFFSKNNLRKIAIFFFLTSFLTFFLNEKPNLVFEKDQKFFAIYDEENGLIFSKKLRASEKRDYWLGYFGETKFNYFNKIKFNNSSKTEFNYSSKEKLGYSEVSYSKTDYIKNQKIPGLICSEKNCIYEKNSNKFLILIARNKLDEICENLQKNNFNYLVNLTAKYELPNCAINIANKSTINKTELKIIDNQNFLKNGGYFFFLKNNKPAKLKTSF